MTESQIGDRRTRLRKKRKKRKRRSIKNGKAMRISLGEERR
jgi:hypothetical protein